MKREIQWMLDDLKTLHPDWDHKTLCAVRDALALYDDRHPKWKTCEWCHGTGWVINYNYDGVCGLCDGDGGYYIRPLPWNIIISIWNRTFNSQSK